MGVEVAGFGITIWGLGFGVEDLGSKVKGSEFGVWDLGLGFRV